MDSLDVEVVSDNEQKFYWDDLTEMQLSLVIAVYSFHLLKKGSKLKRIFDLAKPYIIIDNKGKYCRIAKESIDVVFLLLREYA